MARQIAEAIGEELWYIPDLIREGRYAFQVRAGERISGLVPECVETLVEQYYR